MVFSHTERQLPAYTGSTIVDTSPATNAGRGSTPHTLPLSLEKDLISRRNLPLSFEKAAALTRRASVNHVKSRGIPPGLVKSRWASPNDQKSQSSSSVSSALPITYDEPEPEKKSWFSSAFGDSDAMIAGFTSQISAGNSAG